MHTRARSLVPDLQRLLHPDDGESPSHDIVLLLPACSSDGDPDTAVAAAAAAADTVRVPAHRCVLAARSDKFRAMFEGGFSEGFGGGSGGGGVSSSSAVQEVALPHWGAPAFRAFLTYAYTGEGPSLDPVSPNGLEACGEDEAEAVEHLIAELLLLADECLADGLRLLCEHALGQRLLRWKGNTRVCSVFCVVKATRPLDL